MGAAGLSVCCGRCTRGRRTRRGFQHVDTWIFDLDNTLYPASCNLFAEVDQRMGAYIAKTIGVPFEHARHLQKAYYRQFGTTLAGLMKVHKLPPGPFLDYVHDIDLSVVPELPELAAAIAALPGRRLIFTNGSRRHAENVATKLGVLHLFEDICDIAALEYVPKPEREAFDRLLKLHAIAPARAARCSKICRTISRSPRARHDDGARAFRLHRPPGATEDPRMARASRPHPLPDARSDGLSQDRDYFANRQPTSDSLIRGR